MRAAVWYGRRKHEGSRCSGCAGAWTRRGQDQGRLDRDLRNGPPRVCSRSDLDAHYTHPLTGKAAPLIQGHEFAGIIAEVGPRVEGFKPGDRVTADSETIAASAGPACAMNTACATKPPSWDWAAMALSRPISPSQWTLSFTFLQSSPAESIIFRAHGSRHTRPAARTVDGRRECVVDWRRQPGSTPVSTGQACGSQPGVHGGAERHASRSRTKPGRHGVPSEEVDVVEEIKKRTGGIGVDLAIDDAGISETLTMASNALGLRAASWRSVSLKSRQL